MKPVQHRIEIGQARGELVGGGGDFWEQTVRLTWQMNQKHKLGIYYNNKKRTSFNANTTTSHESLNASYFFPFSDNLVQWSAPMTNRLLLEAGFWRHQETWGGKRADADLVDPLAVGVTDNNPQTLVPGYVQFIQNYHGRVGATDTASHNPNYRGNFAASYVTGAPKPPEPFPRRIDAVLRWFRVIKSALPSPLKSADLKKPGEKPAGKGVGWPKPPCPSPR